MKLFYIEREAFYGIPARVVNNNRDQAFNNPDATITATTTQGFAANAAGFVSSFPVVGNAVAKYRNAPLPPDEWETITEALKGKLSNMCTYASRKSFSTNLIQQMIQVSSSGQYERISLKIEIFCQIPFFRDYALIPSPFRIQREFWGNKRNNTERKSWHSRKFTRQKRTATCARS